jgi:tetratricopeptide (TPR) repeat protein
LYERTFAIEDKTAIFKNFERFDNEKIISLIITFPWLSRIFYTKMKYFDLGNSQEYINRYNSNQRIDEAEISFKIFQYQFSELIEYVKEQKSSLVIITTPLNLETRPKEICSHATTNQVIEVQQEIDNLIKEGNFKEAYPKALELADATPGNALSFYLLGQSALRLGKTVEAKQALLKSTVFDCNHWRGNAIYNAIMRSLGAKNLNTIVDFDQYMAASINKDGLFIDDLYPQTIFYQTVAHDLVEAIKLILSTRT